MEAESVIDEVAIVRAAAHDVIFVHVKGDVANVARPAVAMVATDGH